MKISAILLDHMGNDFTPIKQARLSYNRGLSTPEKDCELIEHLLKLKHMVPFEHISLTFEINVPVFVQRQLVKYRMSSWSEVSRRYTNYETDDGFFIPDVSNLENCNEIEITISDIYDKIKQAYNKLIELGVKKEDQRIVLPVSYFTKILWTMNMREFIHILDQRLDNHQQHETREQVQMMLNEVEPYFPNIIKTYLKIKGEYK